jgi:AMMECR1 domain-containing protein
LLEKNRDTGLTAAEEERWQQIEYLEHLIRKAKIRAAQQVAVA